MKRGTLLSPERAGRVRLESSRRQEKDTAADLGGEVVRGSGNQWHSKGDVKAAKHLIECKETAKGSYRLTRNDYQKIRLYALLNGKIPVMQIKMGDDTRVAVIDWTYFTDLVNGDTNGARKPTRRRGRKSREEAPPDQGRKA